MSLVYAKKSDEIECALRVLLHVTVACGTEILMCEGHQESWGYVLYESLPYRPGFKNHRGLRTTH